MRATRQHCSLLCISHITGWPAEQCGSGNSPGLISATFSRVGDDWHHSAWDFRNIIAAGPKKVHLDVQFTRYRDDNSAIGFRSLWIVTENGGRWAVAAHSSFAD
jgi:hypothetical protein